MSPQGEANSELPELQPLSGKQPTQTISKRSGPDADNPNNWGVEETISKISSMDPSLSIHLGAFQTHEIDGKALVLLTTTLLMEHMQFKLGPALKISSIIENLKGNKHLSHGWLYYITLFQKLTVSQLQMFQKVEYGWGPIFKVVLEC